MQKPLATFVLHAYQPINQKEDVLERIVNRCYLPFFQKLLEFGQIRITLNINGCLIEQLAHNYSRVIELISEGIKTGQIELMGTAYYHPLLPFLTEDELDYQIKKQQKMLEELFKIRSSVFFPPELAISKKVLERVRKNNYKVVIAPVNIATNRFGGIITTRYGDMVIIKRNKDLSNAISFNGYQGDYQKALIDVRNYNNTHNFPVVYAMDIETYGEHINKYYNFFFKLADRLETLKLSSILTLYDFDKLRDFSASSWSTSDNDQKKGVPFPLWYHPDNPLHHLQHLHLDLLREAKNSVGNIFPEFQEPYAASFYSCQFWWASGHWWSPEMIRAGLKMQRKALKTILNKADDMTRALFFRISDKIISKIEAILAYRRK